jgi:ribosomal protein S18 acetylase RimI-like enzyme
MSDSTPEDSPGSEPAPSDGIALAGADQAETVSRLLAEFRDLLGRGPEDAEIRASVEKLLGDPGTEFLIGLGEGAEPAGLAQVRYRWSVWTSSEDCWLEDLFVAERARRGGLGSALVAAVIERARARGCGRVELDVDADNEAALALYERFEFSHHAKSAAGSLLMGRRL